MSTDTRPEDAYNIPRQELKENIRTYGQPERLSSDQRIDEILRIVRTLQFAVPPEKLPPIVPEWMKQLRKVEGMSQKNTIICDTCGKDIGSSKDIVDYYLELQAIPKRIIPKEAGDDTPNVIKQSEINGPMHFCDLNCLRLNKVVYVK